MKGTYTTRETAERFGYNTRHFQRMVKDGVAPVTPITGTFRFSKALVDFIVDAQSQVEAVKAESYRRWLLEPMDESDTIAAWKAGVEGES